MAQLNVNLADDRLSALQRYASRRQTEVASLIEWYVEYLLAGGEPVRMAATELPSVHELAAAAEHGGSFDWLAHEPEIYTLDDGEPI